ncbi:MAG: tetraacyldisaccharide 4'-kinase [Bacteroidota bacterium]|nr:tetraacyldisaccharide 4'-kinase [Bacteroidota bacterium]
MKPSRLFLPFVPLYGLAAMLRNWFFDIGIFHSIDVGVPVISVGNITTGGTGKTPIVKSIASILIENGRHVAIISRGYGRNSNGTIIVSDGKNILTDADLGGDEPLLLAEQLRKAIVIVDEDRIRGAQKAIKEFGATVIVLDDGFQHRYIKRLKNIVLIDSQHSPFKTSLLPAGYRRELISSFKRSDAIVVTKANDINEALPLLKNTELDSIAHKFSSSFQPSGIRHLFGGVKQSLTMLKGHTAIGLCGIAKPESFQQSLEQCGVRVNKYFNFPDHHKFTRDDIEQVMNSFKMNNADFIITTEKDAVRLKEFEMVLKQLPIVMLSMEVVMHQNEAWKKFILDGLH